MSSINAKNVAKEVLESLGKKKKIKLRQIALKNGYAVNTADNPKNIVETKSYQSVVAPVVNRMEALRDKIMAEMDSKDLSKERFSTLSMSLAAMNHDIQLLKGKSTSNVAVSVNDYRDLSDDELRQITSGKGISTEGVSEA